MLTTPGGKDAGKPFVLREWQKDIIRGIYDNPTGEWTRRVRRVLISMAKKNGKTALIAALVLVHLVGPEAGHGQEIYSAANDREQAGIVYRAAEAMVLADPDLSLLVRCIRSKKRLVCHHFGSFYQALSADVKTKEGISPTVWIYDELGKTKNPELYESLSNAQGAWEEPLGIVISVQAADPSAIMSELVDDAKRVLKGEVSDPTLAAFIYEVPRDVDPLDERYWRLANPALGDFLSLTDMREAAKHAGRLPSRLNAFRNLRLNQQVDGIDQLIGSDDWKACGDPVDLESLRGRVCYGGLDLSKRLDLTALALVFPGEDRTDVLMRCWTPEHLLAERALKDKAPYPTWVDQGHLLTTPGRVVDYAYVAQEIAALAALYEIRGIAFDPWRIDDLFAAFQAEGVASHVRKLPRPGEPPPETPPEPGEGLALVTWHQGFATMGPAVDAIELAIVEGELRHGMHPVLTWTASNAIAIQDANANRKLDKKRARNRIDPFVALTMAIGLAKRLPEFEQQETGSIWDEIAAASAAANKA